MAFGFFKLGFVYIGVLVCIESSIPKQVVYLLPCQTSCGRAKF